MSDDPFDLPDDDEVSTEAEGNAKRNRELAEMRKAAKELKNVMPELERLRAFEAERKQADRTQAISGAFTALGLNPKHAEFYQGEDATPEAVRAWAVEKEFLAAAENEAPPVPAEAGFTPTVFDGASPVGSKTYSQEEFEALLKTDQKKAFALYQSGRVRMDRFTDIGGEAVHR